ncbi:MAG: SRPBCC family protein [Ramlibacter sp.]|nr:SRPBCC family protein [Ramlibacter sp.]
MKVVNVHQRLLHATPRQAGALIDGLASPGDALWPHRTWPKMKFDGPLGVGATGGHGPIRYFVEAYTPGRSIRFRFIEPRGFIGWHACEILDATPVHCVLEHRIEMTLRGRALLTWPLVTRPLHDACVEDMLSRAQEALGNEPKATPWSARVRLLRWLVSRGTARPQPQPTRREHVLY